MDYRYPAAFDQEAPDGEAPHQAELYEGRLLMPAHAGVRAWHQRFVSGSNDPNASSAGAVSLFRMSPDTNGPPPAAEHRLLPPQLELDPGELALRPRRGLWPADNAIDPDSRILSNPLRTLIHGADPPSRPTTAANSGAQQVLAGVAAASLLLLIFA